MRSNTCPLCGEGWPESNDWITDEMVNRAREAIEATVDLYDGHVLDDDEANAVVRLSLEAALKASRHR